MLASNLVYRRGKQEAGLNNFRHLLFAVLDGVNNGKISGEEKIFHNVLLTNRSILKMNVFDNYSSEKSG